MSDSSDLIFAGMVGFLGMILVYAAELPFQLFYGVLIFAGALLFPTVYGYANAPRKSQKQVSQAKRRIRSAEREKDEAIEKKQEMEQQMKEAKQRANEEIRRRKELEKDVKKRQENMTQEINEKAERKAQELAQEKAEEYLEEWVAKERNRLEAENDLANLANFGKVREEAQEEVKEEREKFRKLAQIVIEDEELLELLWSGPITEERFKVLFRATKDPRLKQEMESIQEVNGDLDLWIERKAKELEKTEEPQEEQQPETETEEVETEGLFDTGEETPELGEGKEKPVSELSGEELFVRLKEEFSTTKKDIIRCLEKGISSSSKIADKLGVTPQTVRNHYGGLKEHGLITTGATGAGLTEDGLRFAEILQ